MKLKVSKIDAARRQLDMAIKLWFHDDDPVVIHALACAAFQVVQDLNDKKGNKDQTLLEMTRSVIKTEHVEEAMALVRKPMNFFKHADRDPNAILEFESDISMAFFGITITGLGSLGEQKSDLQAIFLHWAMLHRPQWFKESNEILKKLGPDRVEILKDGTKAEFLETFLISFAKKKLKG